MVELDAATRTLRAWFRAGPADVIEVGPNTTKWVGTVGEQGHLYQISQYDLAERLLGMVERGEDPIVPLEDAGKRVQ